MFHSVPHLGANCGVLWCAVQRFGTMSDPVRLGRSGPDLPFIVVFARACMELWCISSIVHYYTGVLRLNFF